MASGSPSGWATHKIANNQGWAALLDHQPDQFSVIDNRTVITGSFNWSPSAAHQNDEVLLVIESPLLAAHFTREMDRLWRGAELGINERLARKLAANRRRCGSGVRREVAGAARGSVGRNNQPASGHQPTASSRRAIH